MYIEVRRDHGARLPITEQPKKGAVFTAWADGGQDGKRARVTLTVTQVDETTLTYRLETYDAGCRAVYVHADGSVPVLEQETAAEAVSDDSGATALEPSREREPIYAGTPPHRYRTVMGVPGCAECDQEAYADIHNPQLHPQLMVDHPLKIGAVPATGGRPGGYIVCADCPPGRRAGPAYHPKG